MKFYLTILFCCAWAVLPAQPSQQEKPARLLSTLHFQEFNGGVMLVRAAMGNSKDSLNFILDSGSGGASLDSATCVEFGFAPRSTDSTVSGIGSSRKAKFLYGQRIQFPGLQVDSLNFHINDYSLLSSVYGIKIDGLLGYQFFKKYILDVDFEKNTIQVYTPGTFSYPKKSHTFYPIFAGIPIEQAAVQDATNILQRFFLDSGAGLALMICADVAKDSNLLSPKIIPVETQAEGMSNKVGMKLTVVKKVKMGPYTFKKVPTFIYTDEHQVFNYPHTAGLIGNELMRRFNIVFNYPAKEINFLPNKHYNANFDYSYNGLSIYYHDGEIVVEEIVKDSPAAKSGLQIGDRIIAVGNNFSGNILTYKDLINVQNETVPLTILRNKELYKINLNTGDIRTYGKKLRKLGKKKE